MHRNASTTANYLRQRDEAMVGGAIALFSSRTTIARLLKGLAKERQRVDAKIEGLAALQVIQLRKPAKQRSAHA
jgi:hypothetical protein